MSTMTGRVGELEYRVLDKIDDLEEYQRRVKLRIFGIKETKGEDTGLTIHEDLIASTISVFRAAVSQYVRGNTLDDHVLEIDRCLKKYPDNDLSLAALTTGSDNAPKTMTGHHGNKEIVKCIANYFGPIKYTICMYTR
ncbi:hypothetical protein J6590_076566 [Homalodisca vitripennis]|nr:hypothetical protein J6590_076566 [Homalodisca vitripennis]